MKKTICDRCERVITPAEPGEMLVIYKPLEIIQKDLCAACAFKLRKWLERESINE